MRVLTRLRKLAFYLRELRNWPAVAAMHVTGRPVRRLRLRDGHVIHLLDPRHEIWAFDAIYRARCYDVDFPGLPTDGTVVDLGANVGIFTLLAATRLVPNGRVLAVEANPECARLLEQTTSGCRNVTIWCGAVGGTGLLWLAHDSLSASIFRSHDAVRAVDAAAIPIEQVLRFDARIDLLKANIEGAEYPTGHMVVLDAGGTARFRALADSRVMLVGGAPLDGPRFIWWNFVASSHERIERAKDDWAAQRFPRVPGETEFIPLPESREPPPKGQPL